MRHWGVTAALHQGQEAERASCEGVSDFEVVGEDCVVWASAANGAVEVVVSARSMRRVTRYRGLRLPF